MGLNSGSIRIWTEELLLCCVIFISVYYTDCVMQLHLIFLDHTNFDPFLRELRSTVTHSFRETIKTMFLKILWYNCLLLKTREISWNMRVRVLSLTLLKTKQWLMKCITFYFKTTIEMNNDEIFYLWYNIISRLFESLSIMNRIQI